MSTAVDTAHRAAQAAPGGGDARPRRSAGTALRTLSRGLGQTLVTFGLVALLFVAYQLWMTDLVAAGHQDELGRQLEQEWADRATVTGPDQSSGLPPAADSDEAATAGADPAAGSPGTDGPAAPADVPEPATVQEPTVQGSAAQGARAARITAGVGDPFAVVHLPRLGSDWSRVVVEGTAQRQLAQGPGHYIGTAMPGEPGNFALAGHRVGHGAPFLDLDRLRPGDPVVVETADHWFVYRVLGDPASGSFDGDPSGIPGRRIVPPGAIGVIAATPGDPAAGTPDAAYLTMTTCHPKYSARQRLIVHARMDSAPLAKADAPDGPPELRG